MVYMVDGVRSVHDMDRLTRMYEYLNNAGELYFIEALKKCGNRIFQQCYIKLRDCYAYVVVSLSSY